MKNSTKPAVSIADKDALRQTLKDIYAQMGIVPDASSTAPKSRDLMTKDGVRPEDNAFSCAIVSARDE